MDLISPLAALVNSPEFFAQICDHLAGGGTLVEFCQLHQGLSYPATLRWIRQDVVRRDLYERAQRDRDEWQIDRILRELRDMAAFDLADMLDADGNQKPFQEWPSKLQRAVSMVKKNKDGTEVKFVDKLKALEMLGRAAGMFRDKVEHSGKITLETLVSQSMELEKKGSNE